MAERQIEMKSDAFSLVVESTVNRYFSVPEASLNLRLKPHITYTSLYGTVDNISQDAEKTYKHFSNTVKPEIVLSSTEAAWGKQL